MCQARRVTSRTQWTETAEPLRESGPVTPGRLYITVTARRFRVPVEISLSDTVTGLNFGLQFGS
jgi:hypothetical protein